jgi:magnesium-protoporphyrin O-methyltransferase
MTAPRYEAQRERIAEYFDRTAVSAWAQLTSDAPVSRVRRTVRAGRDAMRATILSWLPLDLRGARVLDAGCGTGLLSRALAERGAKVVGVDLAPAMIDLARERVPAALGIDFRSGDMLDARLGRFDYVVAMDSLIHYALTDSARAIMELGVRTAGAMIVTLAPRTPLLTLMHAAGRMFPRGDRAPAIQPAAERAVREAAAIEGWEFARSASVSHGFYISRAYELVRSR